MLKTGVICNNANLTFNKEEQAWNISGDPTEGSLLVLARKAGLPRLIEGFKRIGEIPFNSQRKMRVTFVKFKNQVSLHVVGAPEVIIKQSARILVNSNVRQIGNNEKKDFLEQCNKLAKQGYRLLALGYGDNISSTIEDKNKEVEDIILIGIVGMIDPPRESVQEAVRECKSAGIKPVMITGDHPLTATAISNEVGIDGDLLEGVALETMDKNELINFVENIGIYARTSS